MNYSENKTYGRTIIRGSAKNKFQKKLIASWLTCFCIGFLIGLVFMFGLTHIFSCMKVKNVEAAPVVIEEPTVVEEPVIVEEPEPEIISLGEYKLTAYCPCYECSEGWGNSTSTGAIATQGRTIAVDPKVIPYGTEVVIDGHTYIAEDCGGAIKGNRIDIYFEDHQEALEFGVQYKEVFVRG